MDDLLERKGSCLVLWVTSICYILCNGFRFSYLFLYFYVLFYANLYFAQLNHFHIINALFRVLPIEHSSLTEQIVHFYPVDKESMQRVLFYGY